jgi:arylsulfatase A-like enzyme
MKRSFYILTALLVFGCAPQAVAAEHAPKPPNVLLIVVDDLGWRDLSVQGSTFYETPNVDQLAANGVRFTHGYASAQVCSPSRASLMTGRFPLRMGTTDWFGAKAGEAWKRNTLMLPAPYTQRLDPDRITVAEAFREAGYTTFFAGKWHLGEREEDWPEFHGFEINKGGHNRGSPPGGFFAPYDNPRLKSGPAGEALPLRLADETVAFIEGHQDQPFFATLCFYTVHAPAQTTRALWEKYRKKAGTMPQPVSRMAPERRMPTRVVQDNPIYAGMIEMMDTAVGRVLNALERMDLLGDTIIVFTSDNGGVTSGDHWATSILPLRGGKGYQWEGGLRVPFIVSWRGSLAPSVNTEASVIGTDIYPTLLELAGLPLRPQEHLDGVSLVPALKGGGLPPRSLIWHYPHYSNQGGDPSSIIQHGDWKLIHYHETGRDELYRRGDDPMEQYDVALRFPEQARNLREELNGWLKKTKARFPTTNPSFDASKFAVQEAGIGGRFLFERDAEAARILSPDWEPDPTWWGSEPATESPDSDD